MTDQPLSVDDYFSTLCADQGWEPLRSPAGGYQLTLPGASVEEPRHLMVSLGNHPGAGPIAHLWSVVGPLDPETDLRRLLEENGWLPCGSLAIYQDDVIVVATIRLATTPLEEAARVAGAVSELAATWDLAAPMPEPDDEGLWRVLP